MTDQPKSSLEPLMPAQPVAPGAEDFSARVHTLLDGKPKDEETVSQSFAGLDKMFDRIAAGLYTIASMLVGEGEESIRLIENAVASARFVPGETALEARQSSRLALAHAAVQLLTQREPECLAAPHNLVTGGGCIGDDELDAVGVSHDELERMLSGPDKDRVRTWLAGLGTPMRVVFVLRAVALLPTSAIAELFHAEAGPSAAAWTAEQVREISRQALCSLASQLLHASIR